MSLTREFYKPRIGTTQNGGFLRNHNDHTEITAVNSDERHAFIKPHFERALARDAGDYRTHGPTLQHFGPVHTKVITGNPIPNPPVLYAFNKVKYSNKPFEARKHRGDIVVAPYVAVAAHCEQWAGTEETTMSSSILTGGRRWDRCGLFEVESPSSSTPWIRDGGSDWSNGVTNIIYDRVRGVQVQPSSWLFNQARLDDLVRMLPQSPEPHQCQAICETLSEANAGMLDVLTSLAEAPETVKSIYAGIKAILKIYKDAKRKEIRLMNRLPKVSRYGGYNNSGKAKAERIALTEDITNAVADVYLNARYNIMPNVSMIADLLDTVDALGRMYMRWRTTIRSSVPQDWYSDLWLPDGTSVEVNMEDTFRAFIKRRFAVNDALSSWFNLTSMDAAKTIWELVPLSFVIDWVLGIGDFISSLSISQNANYVQGSTISWRREGSLIVTGPEKQKAVVQLQLYDRRVINPSDYNRVRTDPEMNIYRWLDAIALSWKIFVPSYRAEIADLHKQLRLSRL